MGEKQGSKRRVPARYLIVARYQENTDWIVQAKDWEVHVVQKGTDLPNEGREASSYFWALHSLFPRLRAADIVGCVQGNPFEHAENFWKELHNEVQDFEWIGDWRTECDRTGDPHHSGLPLEEKCKEWCGVPCPPMVKFVAGAQFLVTGRVIKRRPRRQYRELQHEMCHGDNPWSMERLWRLFFCPTDYRRS